MAVLYRIRAARRSASKISINDFVSVRQAEWLEDFEPLAQVGSAEPLDQLASCLGLEPPGLAPSGRRAYHHRAYRHAASFHHAAYGQTDPSDHDGRDYRFCLQSYRR